MTLLEWLWGQITERVKAGYWGKLTISFEGGRPVHLDWHEGQKPPAGLTLE